MANALLSLGIVGKPGNGLFNELTVIDSLIDPAASGLVAMTLTLNGAFGPTPWGVYFSRDGINVVMQWVAVAQLATANAILTATAGVAPGVPPGFRPLTEITALIPVSNSGAAAIGMITVDTAGDVQISASVANASFASGDPAGIGASSVSWVVS